MPAGSRPRTSSSARSRSRSSTPSSALLTGAAEDVSIHGLSVVVRSEPRGLRTGDRIAHVRVTCDAGMLHDGSAVVRRVTERADVWVIGLELPAGLDLGRIYRSASRRDFASRWQALKQKTSASNVRPAFKAWVADLRAALGSAQDLLAAEERALAGEDRRRRLEAEADYLAVVAPDLLEHPRAGQARPRAHGRRLQRGRARRAPRLLRAPPRTAPRHVAVPAPALARSRSATRATTR